MLYSCIKRLPKCPRCRFPRGRSKGHCKNTISQVRKVFNCRAGNVTEAPIAPPEIDYGDYEDFFDTAIERYVSSKDIYESDYEY